MFFKNIYDKFRAIKLYFSTSVLMVILNVLGLVFSWSEFNAISEGKALVVASNIILPFVILIVCTIEMGLAIYFISAACNIGYDIKKSLKISINLLMWMPITTLIDDLGILLFDIKFSTVGLVGNFAFIPFYIVAFCSIYNLLPKLSEDITRKKKIVFSIISTIILFFVTFI